MDLLCSSRVIRGSSVCLQLTSIFLLWLLWKEWCFLLKSVKIIAVLQCHTFVLACDILEIQHIYHELSDLQGSDAVLLSEHFPMFQRNVVNHTPHDTVSHPRRPDSSATWLSWPQTSHLSHYCLFRCNIMTHR
jgi:hypothetical protein